MKLLSAATTFLLIQGAASQTTCPDASSGDWGETKVNGDHLIFKHAIVTSADGKKVLCAHLVSALGGWVGIGVSPTGKMTDGEVVIGQPDGNSVLKYTGQLMVRITAMPDDKQTLMETSISVADGKTTMTFAKYLVEDGEHEIVAGGAENPMMYALGSDGVGKAGYHNNNRGFFKVDFAAASPPESKESTPPAPTPANPAPTPSSAISSKIAGTVLAGAGLAAVWFGM